MDAPNSSTGGYSQRKPPQPNPQGIRVDKLGSSRATGGKPTATFNYDDSKPVALRKPSSQNQSLGLMNTIKGNFIALKFRTNIEVEGVGEYQIEITNVVNTKTFEKRHIVPSLMNMANF